ELDHDRCGTRATRSGSRERKTHAGDNVACCGASCSRPDIGGDRLLVDGAWIAESGIRPRGTRSLFDTDCADAGRWGVEDAVVKIEALFLLCLYGHLALWPVVHMNLSGRDYFSS